MRIEDVLVEMSFINAFGDAQIESPRPITPDELLELASQQPDTLVISKVDGEWPEDVVEAVTNGIHGPPYNVGSVDSKCRVLAFAALDALLEAGNG